MLDANRRLLRVGVLQVTLYAGEALFLMRKKPSKTLASWSSRQDAEQITVGDGAKFFRPIVEVKQAVVWEGARLLLF